MNKKRIALCIELSKEDKKKLEKFTEISTAGILKRHTHLISEEELLNDCIGHEIVIIGLENVTKRCIDAWTGSGMKLIGCSRGTPVNIDWDEVNKHRIPFIYAPGRNAVAVAEFTIGLMLAAIRRIAITSTALKLGKHLGEPIDDFYKVPMVKDVVWRKMGEPRILEIYGKGFELFEKILGIVGYGAIGSRVARIAKGMGMQVIAYDSYISADQMEADGVKAVTHDELIKTSDIISIHLAVTPETKGMIDESWFELMKPSAYFINTSRASVVDQKAFIDTMLRKKIAGAALDVCWHEPIPSNHPLLTMDNVLITPHIGGITYEVEHKWTSEIITQEILRYCKGEPLQYLWKRMD